LSSIDCTGSTALTSEIML